MEVLGRSSRPRLQRAYNRRFFNRRAQLAKHHVKKCRKESSSGEGESLHITCHRSKPAICWLESQAHSLTVETTEPASQHSRASPLPSSRHATPRHFPRSLAAASCLKNSGAGSLPGTPPHKPGQLYNTHEQRVGGLETSHDPRVCSGDASLGRDGFPQKRT